MIRAGKFTFHEMNVAFHFVRSSIYDPWQTIGVMLSYAFAGRAKYLHDYKHHETAFNNAVADAGPTICGTTLFMEDWRRDRQGVNSVICPVINYCTQQSDWKSVLNELYKTYVGADGHRAFAALSLMMQRRDRFILTSSIDRSTDSELMQELQKAGLI